MTDRPPVPRYLFEIEIDNERACAYVNRVDDPGGRYCEYDALDAERQRVEEQIAGLTIDKTNLAFGLNQAVTERDQALALLKDAPDHSDLDAAVFECNRLTGENNHLRALLMLAINYAEACEAGFDRQDDYVPPDWLIKARNAVLGQSDEAKNG